MLIFCLQSRERYKVPKQLDNLWMMLQSENKFAGVVYECNNDGRNFIAIKLLKWIWRFESYISKNY